MTSAYTQQEDFWFRNDDGSLTTATFMGLQGSNQTIAGDTVFRLRILVREINSKNDPWAFQAYAKKNGLGSFTAVTTTRTDGLQYADDGNSIADGTTITVQELTWSTGTWTDGEYDDAQTAAGTGTIGLSGQYTEIEFCLKIDSANATNGDYWEIRLYSTAGTALDNYNATPVLTASIGASPQTVNCQVGSLTAGGQQATVTSPAPPQQVNCQVGTLSATWVRASVVPFYSAGLQLWFDFSDISILYQDDSKSTPVTSNDDPIGAVEDKSGSGNDLVQATSGYRPLYKTNVQNSLSAALFDGSDDYLVKSISDWQSSDSAGIVFAVFLLNASPNSENAYLSSFDEGSASLYGIFFQTLLYESFHRLRSWQRNNDVIDDIRGTTSLINATRLVYIKSSGTEYALFVDGAIETLYIGSGTNNGDWLADTPNRDNIVMGAIKYSSLANFFKGHIMEVLYYDSALSQSDIDNVVDYLNDKWGVYQTVTINCNIGSLTLAGQQASIDAPVTIECQVGSLTLAGQQATITSPAPSQQVDCQVGELTVTGQQASVDAPITIDCQVGSLTLTGQLADVDAPITIDCQVGSLTLTGQLASVDAPVTIDCQVGSLTVTGQQASVDAPITIDASYGSLTLSGQQANIAIEGAPQQVDCQVGSLTLTGQQATISTQGAPQQIDCQAGSLAIAGQQAAVISNAPQTIDCQVGSLTTTGQTADIDAPVTISCQPGAIALVGQAASVDAPVTIDGQVGSITLAGQQATIEAPVTIDSQVGSLAIAGQQATIEVGGAPQTINCQVGVVSFNEQQATIIRAVIIGLAVGVISVSGQKAIISGGLAPERRAKKYFYKNIDRLGLRL